ncbi:FIG00876815: hypothetical protein [Richelia intracellularis]|nr:FIG00876815: hypothetical protein [Richelia intracellularis]
MRLLARQESEYFWSTIPEEAFILLGKNNTTDLGQGSMSQSDLMIVAQQNCESISTNNSRSGSSDKIPQPIPFSLTENLLVLVELSSTGKIEWVEEATNWVLNLVRTFLTTGITPEILRQEAEKAEKWRQDLTLQSQDLARRSLELEARREQIQSLEENIKREQNDTPNDDVVKKDD